MRARHEGDSPVPGITQRQLDGIDSLTRLDAAALLRMDHDERVAAIGARRLYETLVDIHRRESEITDGAVLGRTPSPIVDPPLV